MSETPVLVLASTSPRRKDLLHSHGFAFEVIASPVEELNDQSLGPDKMVAENARMKALPVAEAHPQKVVLGADTVVALGGRILGKPRDLDEAAAMLADLNGREHTVHTGVCILHRGSGGDTVFVETTRVRFRDLTQAQRAAYHSRIQPLDKAGAYAAQDDGGAIIESFSGSFSNVIGLPMEALHKHLASFGIQPAKAPVRAPAL
jgi:septum formation protein